VHADRGRRRGLQGPAARTVAFVLELPDVEFDPNAREVRATAHPARAPAPHHRRIVCAACAAVREADGASLLYARRNGPPRRVSTQPLFHALLACLSPCSPSKHCCSRFSPKVFLPELEAVGCPVARRREVERARNWQMVDVESAFPRNSSLVQWRFWALEPGTVRLQVYRACAQEGAAGHMKHPFQLIGENVVTATAEGYQARSRHARRGGGAAARVRRARR